MKKINRELYFEWDTISWSRALKIWNKHLKKNIGGYALEIGGRNGGLSLMLAREYKMNVICSDLNNSNTSALLHQSFQTFHKIKYDNVNCMEINYLDNSFDVVIFKSVIGALSTFENQNLAIQEILRVLKPEGILLFAENLQCSSLHMYLRSVYNHYNSYWRYPKIEDIDYFLRNFNQVETNTTGFFATLSKSKTIKTYLSYFDILIDKIFPKKIDILFMVLLLNKLDIIINNFE